VAAIGLAAFPRARCADWARVDFMLDAAGTPWLNRVERGTGHDGSLAGADGRTAGRLALRVSGRANPARQSWSSRMNQAVRKAPPQTAERPVVTLRSLMAMLLTLFLLGAVGYVGQSLTRATSFPINKVTVEGDFRYLTPVNIQSLVSRSLRAAFSRSTSRKSAVACSKSHGSWRRRSSAAGRMSSGLPSVSSSPPRAGAKHALLNTAADVSRRISARFPQICRSSVVRWAASSKSDHLPRGNRTDARAGIDGRVAGTVRTRRLDRKASQGYPTDSGRNRLGERLERFRLAYDLALAGHMARCRVGRFALHQRFLRSRNGSPRRQNLKRRREVLDMSRAEIPRCAERIGIAW